MHPGSHTPGRLFANPVRRTHGSFRATFAIEEAIGSGEVVSLRPRRFRRCTKLSKNSDSANHALFGHAPVSNVIRSLEL
jgi:hypothetical protein